MRLAWNDVIAAAQRGSVALKTFPLALLAPIFSSNASYQLQILAFHLLFGHKHQTAELLLTLPVSFIVGTIAEAIVARMLLVFHQGRQPSLAQVGEIIRAPGLAPLLARLISLVILWMLLAMVLAGALFVFVFVVKALAFGMAHHGAKMPPPHGWIFAYLMTFALIVGVLVSRYSFVLPMFAATGHGNKELFRTWIESAKRNLWPLRLVNILEYVLFLGIAHALRPLEKGWGLRAFLAVVLSLLVTSAITTWFESLKAELAFTAERTSAMNQFGRGPWTV